MTPADTTTSDFAAAMQRSLEARIAELPTDLEALAEIIERRHLLELLAWDNCAEWVALRRAIASRCTEAKRIPGMGLIRRLKDQRDECADALRGLLEVVERNFPMPAGVHEGSPLDVARKAIAKVPTYEQQLRNIAEGIGMTYEELLAAAANLPPTDGQGAA